VGDSLAVQFDQQEQEEFVMAGHVRVEFALLFK
jgi:hypothetical protein